MSDHADTIRRAIGTDADGEPYAEANAALDALLAERQQAIDALRLIGALAAEYEALEDSPASGTDQWNALRKLLREIRAALVKLGEKP